MNQNMWRPVHWNRIDLFLRTNMAFLHLVFQPLQARPKVLPPPPLVLPPLNQPRLLLPPNNPPTALTNQDDDGGHVEDN